MGRSRYHFIDVTQPHFMTCTVLHWLPVFTRVETTAILLDSLVFLSKEGLKVYGYVILENHLHLVAQSDDLQRDMTRFKSHTARQMLYFLKENNVHTILEQMEFYKKAHKTDRELQFWQEGVHPEVIQGDDMMRQKLEYMHNNPVKRGYVDEPEDWRYSSARNYVGRDDALLDVCKDW